MSISYTNTVNSPLNSSKSKMTYSFAKSERFQEGKPYYIIRYCKKVYTLHEVRSKISSGLGYGERSNMEIKSIVPYPSPCTYNVTPDKQKKKGYSFGLSRENCNKQYLYSHPLADKVTPGPGTYKLSNRIFKKGKIYSFRGKNLFPQSKFALNVPGPGAYNEDSPLKNTGRSIISTIKSIQNTKIDSKGPSRFQTLSSFI